MGRGSYSQGVWISMASPQRRQRPCPMLEVRFLTQAESVHLTTAANPISHSANSPGLTKDGPNVSQFSVGEPHRGCRHRECIALRARSAGVGGHHCSTDRFHWGGIFGPAACDRCERADKPRLGNRKASALSCTWKKRHAWHERWKARPHSCPHVGRSARQSVFRMTWPELISNHKTDAYSPDTTPDY